MQKLIALAAVGIVTGASVATLSMPVARAMEIFSEAQTEIIDNTPVPRKAWFDHSISRMLSGSEPQQTAQGPVIEENGHAH